MTTENFAKEFDPPASKGTISKWENGRYLPNNQRLKKIADLGNVSLNELLYGEYKGRIKRILLDKPNVKDEYIDYVINYFTNTNNHYPREEEVHEEYDTTVNGIEEMAQKKVSEKLLGYRIRNAEEWLYTFLKNPKEDGQFDYIKIAIEQLTEASVNYEETFEVSIDEVFEELNNIEQDKRR